MFLGASCIDTAGSSGAVVLGSRNKSLTSVSGLGLLPFPSRMRVPSFYIQNQSISQI